MFLFSHKMSEKMRKINSRRTRQTSEETYDESDLEQERLLKAQLTLFEGIMLELIKTHYSSFIYNITTLETYGYKHLIITILEYTHELQGVIYSSIRL